LGTFARWAGLLVSLAVLVVVSGCGGGDNSPPVIDPIPDQLASVGSSLSVALRATDPDGDPITFSYKTDIGDLAPRGQIVNGAGGTAVFTWVPIGTDVGIHAVDFYASDGKDKGRRQISVDVKSAAAGAGTPVFIKPLGTGTTFDPLVQSCIEIPVEVQDADSADVALGQDAPLIDGSQLSQDSALGGTWKWCPTPEQVDGGELFTLLLSADDGDGHRVVKSYLIVLQKQSKPNCPGPEPVITHTPTDQTTTFDIPVDISVSDDKGLKYPPLLYYSDKDPGAKPDLSQMTQLAMAKASGDLQNGDWYADIPNPVVDAPPGTSAQLYYLIKVSDNDDAEGDCDHVVFSPPTGAHSIKVTNSGTTGGLAECASCSSDSQCGGGADTCIYVSGDKVCGIACIDDFDCPLTHECSVDPVLSVDGKTSKQCVPTSGKCGGSTALCTDDQFEENDVLSDVKNKPGLAPGSYNVKSCPGTFLDDEDWYPIDISTDSTVSVSINGGSASNLDLMLKDSTGKVVKESSGPTSLESITTCLTPGRYYFHIWAWSQAENSYGLLWSKQSGCAAQCVDDSNEDDDNASQARNANVTTTYTSTAQQICQGDDDWYAVQMFKGETLHATLKFTQTKSSEDLDLYIYDSTSKNLTGCSEADPFACDSSNGGSGTSNEKLDWPITTDGIYYVVVHGWESSTNKYDICLDYTNSTKTANGCPPL